MRLKKKKSVSQWGKNKISVSSVTATLQSKFNLDDEANFSTLAGRNDFITKATLFRLTVSAELNQKKERKKEETRDVSERSETKECSLAF